jgi:hypothetical protein
MANKWPGKKCHKRVKDMTPEEYEQHRIYSNACKQGARDLRKADFVGPLLPKKKVGREEGWMGPPKPRKRRPRPGRKRGTEYYRKKFQRARDTLSDYYVRKSLRKIFKRLGVEVEITPDMIELKRQQMKLMRLANG